jgi:transcriptional regulator GlxA family with amidase domain
MRCNLHATCCAIRAGHLNDSAITTPGSDRTLRQFSFMKCRLAQIVQWERVALEARFQPSTMAALCWVSLRQLERHFAKQFQQTPRDWTRAMRCRLARDLIAKGWSNKAVVFELHFSNESHLCHEFTLHYGQTPQAFGPSFSPQTETGIVS